jgi:signal transduction histidine kinase
VIAESRLSFPTSIIEADISLDRAVEADPDRLAQLLSNLLANAVTHGDADAPIHVRATAVADGFELSVRGKGEPIPPEAIPRLFEPFERGAVRPGAQGLGLGLYIASEIARAHGGSLHAASLAGETVFTFRMPG